MDKWKDGIVGMGMNGLVRQFFASVLKDEIAGLIQNSLLAFPSFRTGGKEKEAENFRDIINELA
ncbi:MAG: hypothetical protein WCL06_13185 [Bacteroidota bacterium]